MNIPAAQAEAAAFLSAQTESEPIETHISAVFVGTEWALKMKKAVSLGFLDFRSLDAREHFCRRELALNAPNAPALYRDVLPLTRNSAGGLEFDGPGPPVEWVLRMAPLPPAAFLDRAEVLPPAMLDRLADTVAALHAHAPPKQGEPAAAFERVIAGNRRAAEAAGVPLHGWAPEAALARIAPRLAERAAAGFYRRCHGDLHLGNFCLRDGDPIAFDALEFDEDLATIDTGYDLALLLMDLELRHGRAAANRVLNRYIARTGDAGFLPALPLFLSLRAVIRAHVEACRDRPWAHYAEAALAYLTPPPPPRLVAIGGLQGTGKTRLARLLAPGLGAAPGALVLRSDEVRKRRFAVAPETPLPAEAYTAAVSEAVHAEISATAEQALRNGHSVIADAVWLDPAMREAVEAAAARAEVGFTGLWLQAPMSVLEQRVSAREGDASDADTGVLARAAEADPGAITWHRLDASDDCTEAAAQLCGCERLAFDPLRS